MATYSAADIVGKTLGTTSKAVDVFRTPGGEKIARIPKDSVIGRVYSYISRPEGVYWMFETTQPFAGSANKSFYVLHTNNALRVLDKDVRSQEQKEFDELNWFQKLITPSPEVVERREELKQGTKKTLIWVGVAVAAFFLIKDLGKEVIKKKL